MTSSRPPTRGDRGRFPLADWIDEHTAAAHQLSSSGMRGALRRYAAAVRRAPPASEGALRALLARRLSVEPDRVFLTHGATEANALALRAIAHAFERRHRRAPRVRTLPPEYPPLAEAARWAGFRPALGRGAAEVLVLSNPNNPSGRWWSPAELDRLRKGAVHLVVDETFREFTEVPSLARRRAPRTWVAGTLTKVYGADEVRCGWLVVPPEEREPFARAYGIVTDGVPAGSRAAAAALLRRGAGVLEESRALFRRNLAELRRRVPEAPELSAPLWFDRGRDGLDGTALAGAALRAGILVAPGTLFGDRSGVRVCLTRPEFPRDLVAYLRVRGRFLSRRR